MRRGFLLFLAGALAVSGCNQEEAAPSMPVEDALPEAREETIVLPVGATTPPMFEGEWRVAGVDRQEIDIGWAMTASIDADAITIVSQCMTFSRSYTREGMTLGMPDVPPATGRIEPPAPVCARMPLPEEQAVSKALQGATLTYRLPDNSLVLDGEGGSLTLFTQ
ncbi:hypothetical protein [Sphingomicrobium nitratireducens]|uniref:hypothetical protein n=1 Tax=Sphingomicrobium nitratireducens TaxID=2964666 RepID=UPI002240D6B1|nr:hypothetical protein [Sphingomicrobium nitratireducens]